MRNRSYDCNTSFLDLLFNTLLGFVALFVLSFAMMNVSKQTKNTEAKSEFIITVTWPKEYDDDVDTYVEDPDGHLVCFKRREDGLMHLDRDDLGKRNDILQTPFGPIEYTENREIVTLRGTTMGEYVVNVHMYMKHEEPPVEVTIQVDKVNPYSTVCIKKVVLKATGDEATAVRFTVDKKGLITSVSDLPKKIVTEYGRGQDEYGDPIFPPPSEFDEENN